jgi:hypothetical protein
METTGYLLAEIPGFGRIFDCGNCGLLHLTVGPVSLTLTTEAYMQLVALLNTSAANFESWMQANRDDNASRRQERDKSRPEGGL